MSSTPISRSGDLRRLWDEGYDIATDGAWLLVRQVPYVDRQKTVQYGVLAVMLTLAGEITTTPSDHRAFFCGSDPCDAEGRPLDNVILSRNESQEAGGLRFALAFSHKPVANGTKRQYRDYHELISGYADILGGYAQAVDPAVSAQPTVRLAPIESDYPFMYSDTASVRAGIGDISRRLSGQTVGIIGLGGTGSYIADLVAKTHVRELHLWDGDQLLQHNAFRSPGATSIDELRRQLSKCDYYQAIYSNIHTRVIGHPYYMEPTCFNELDQLDFAFLAVDDSEVRRSIIPALNERTIPFIDVGIGLAEEGGKLAGLVRVTFVAGDEGREQALKHIPMSGSAEDDAYVANIQIADMNALNAILAVIRWKKHLGVYADFEQECCGTYMINGNEIINDKSV